MSLKFNSIVDPGQEVVSQIAALDRDNPFATAEYLAVRKRLGAEGCAFVLTSDGAPVAGCLAFMTRGRMNSRIEITSLPVLPDPRLFWDGLFEFCKDQGISVLSTHTFGSTETSIAELSNRVALRRRSEYRLDLTQPDLWHGLNRRHQRLIKKAMKAGLEVRGSDDRTAREMHLQLANLSLDRRRGRGEVIDSQITAADVDAFLECGAGSIVQAVVGEQVYATMLVARSENGGYAQSSGTSTEGRDLGASHFLFYEVARRMKAEGARVFNLGGASDGSVGLEQFKLGLGAERIELESAEFYMGSPLKKFATGAISLLKGLTFPI